MSEKKSERPILKTNWGGGLEGTVDGGVNVVVVVVVNRTQSSGLLVSAFGPEWKNASEVPG